MSDLGKAYVQIVPKATGISQQITNTISPGVSTAGKTAGRSFGANFAGMLAKVGIGAAVVKGIQSALNEGAKLQQSYGGLDTLYGEAAEAAKKYAEEAAKAGISANDYAEQAVSFGASLKAAFGGDTAKAAEAANTAIMDMADNAAKMGTPLENIQNAYQGFAKQNYTMLDNLKLGYGGTKSEMERLLADAQKLTGVEYNMDNLGDVYSAIHAIQENLGLTGVAAEEASSTFSGSFGAMKASAQNFLATLTTGGDVEQSMTNLLTSVGNFLFNNFAPMVWNIVQALPGAIGTALELGAAVLIEKGPELINNLVTGIQTGLPQLLEKGQDILSNIRDGIVQNAPILLDYAETLISDFGTKMTEAVPNLITKGADMVVTLKDGIVENLPTLTEGATSIIDSIGTYLDEKLPQVEEMAGTFMETYGAAIVTNAPKVVASIVQAAPSVIRAVFKIQQTITKNLLNLVPKIARIGLSMITGLARGMGGAALGLVRSAMAKIKSAIEEPIQEAKETLSGIVEKIKGFFPIKLGNIFSGIKLPHFNIHGGSAPWGIGGQGERPSISIDWYAKGGIMTKPMLFGGGEAGDEGIVPLDPFWDKLDQMADSIVNGVNTVVSGGGAGGDVYVTLYAYPGGPQMDQFIVRSYDRGKRNGLK